MTSFMKPVIKTLQGSVHAFARYPAAMLSAVIMAVSASIRIQIDNMQPWEKLFDSLQLSVLAAAFAGLFFAVFTARKKGQTLVFWLVNLGVIIGAAALFLFMWLRPGDLPFMTAFRIVAASAVALIGFILLASAAPQVLKYHESLFMTIKSALIAAIYALVILLGLFFIAFAVESLIYEQLSQDIYAHIAVWSAFAWFAFFLGYFPVFNPSQKPEQFEIAKKVPRFIEVLLLYVMIPLMAMLSVVLLIWVIQILAAGNWPSFNQLSVIFTIYSFIGIWLSLMVTSFKNGFAKWFRRLFPIVALVFLAFVFYALVLQINRHGLKLSEYFVSVMILFAALSALVLLVLKESRQRLTGYLSIILIVLMVLPYTSFLDLPALAQAARLRNALEAAEMIEDNQIISTADSGQLSRDEKEKITASAEFLLRNQEARQPAWFTSSINTMSQFTAVFGFAATYPEWNPGDMPPVKTVYLTMPAGSLPLADYEHMLLLEDKRYMPNGNTAILSGRSGDYEIVFSGTIDQAEFNQNTGFAIFMDDEKLDEYDLTHYFSDLADRYMTDETWREPEIPLTDMTLAVSVDKLDLLLVFSFIEIYEEAGQRRITYTVNSILWKENT